MRFSFLLLGIIYGRDAIRCLREKISTSRHVREEEEENYIDSLYFVYSSFRLGRYWWSNYMVRRQTKEDWELKKRRNDWERDGRQRLESQRKKTPPYLLFNQEPESASSSISRWTIKYKRFHLHTWTCVIECATYLFASAIAYPPAVMLLLKSNERKMSWIKFSPVISHFPCVPHNNIFKK